MTKEEIKKIWYLKNRSRILEKRKQYYLDNREIKLKYARNSRKNNIEYNKKWKKEYRTRNKEIIKEKVKENKGVARAKKLNKVFGITLEKYNEMFENQQGLCAICGNPETIKTKAGATRMLAVDHDHNTGRVRGLLCMKHNTALGNFSDDLQLLENAIEYLKKNEKRTI